MDGWGGGIAAKPNLHPVGEHVQRKSSLNANFATGSLRPGFGATPSVLGTAFGRKKTYSSAARAAAKDASRARLLDAAEALFAERGYDGAGVAEIAARAGVAPSLIVARFGGKAGLLYEVVRRHNAPQLAAIAALAAEGAGDGLGAWERIGRLALACARMDLARPRLLAAMQALSWQWDAATERRNRDEVAPLLAAVAAALAGGAAAGEVRAGADPAAGAEAFWALYTLALRPGVFEGAPAEGCAARAVAALRALLAPDHAAAAPAPPPADPPG